jgi:hypothetical protein
MAPDAKEKKCANGNDCKQVVGTHCIGCSKDFCIKHFNDHRRSLDEKLNGMEKECDDLKNKLNQQRNKPDLKSFEKQIDDWERDSIDKIREQAKTLREGLPQSAQNRISELYEKLQQMFEQLKKDREDNNFIEADLDRWKENLEKLKKDCDESLICVDQRDPVPLVQHISVRWLETANELFERASDNRVQIEEKGKVAVRPDSWNPTEVRGKKEYSSGCHEIRLHIEQLLGEWIFFGINSKSTPLQTGSHESKSAYGWSSNNYIWMNGLGQSNDSKFVIEMRTNDIIILTFDCEKRKILMVNERTKAKHELMVNFYNCSFPWQLHVILYEPKSRVRILSS